jgi:hypothetical protein
MLALEKKNTKIRLILGTSVPSLGGHAILATMTNGAVGIEVRVK